MATKTSHLVRPLVALVALVAAMAAILIAYSASPTHAAGSCSTTAGTTTCTFSPTGSEDTFVVPAGVSTIHVVATGATGTRGDPSPRAGRRGARVSGDLKVTPGRTLYVNVGGSPTGGSVGFNGGGLGFGEAGDGGGASDVRTVSRDQDGSLASRMIVAGGGGGGGSGDIVASRCFPSIGGSGGDAGSDGGDGMPCEGNPGGTGGKAGGQSEGGDGGIPGGQSGSLGQGGNGARTESFDGGGGGGGYYGGGGGGGGTKFSTSGGGGGGSNLIPEGGTATISDSGPSVTISYQAGVGEEPPTEPEDKQACKKGGYEALGFKNQGQCIKAVNANN
jgi:hypothetical protein